MKVTALYRIGDNYVVGDDKKIYRLPFRSIDKKHHSLRELKPLKKGYYIDGTYTKKELIKYEPIEPYTLIESKITPF